MAEKEQKNPGDVGAELTAASPEKRWTELNQCDPSPGQRREELVRINAIAANDSAEKPTVTANGHDPTFEAAVAERILLLNRYFDRLPDSHPKYRVLELIGRGGMGTVFKAEQRTPVKRMVAIKLVKPGFDSKEILARFESERQALARMDHGSVAKVFDAGADDLGRPYFVMEYVPGISITDFADQNKLTIKQRLELFMEVCSAIAHAHSKAIIHRDVKSGNVLACFSNGKPVVKVIDFGIAKALSGDRLTELTMSTRYGQPMGTYETMSPEQAEGSPDIDTRTDVYALGALLYELLAGAAPFDRAVFAKSADQEIRRIIREVEPPRPCDRLTSMGIAGTKVALARQTPLDALANELRTELEWIPLMAIRKERDRRYATPLEMAADIQRYLEHRPLRAGPETLNYILRKNLRRHRVAVAAGLAIFLSLAGGLAVSSYLLARAVRDEAVIKRAITDIESAMAFGGDYEADHKDLISARRIHANALDEMRAHNQTSAAVLAGLTQIDSSPGGEIPLLGAYGEDGGVAAFRGHTKHPNNVVVIPGTRRALTAGSDGTLCLWDLATGRALHSAHRSDKPLAYVTLAADSKTAITAGYDGQIRFWDVDTLKEASSPIKIPNNQEGWMVALSPDGNRLVAGTNDKELWLWETNNGQWSDGKLLCTANESIPAIAFPPNESRFVVIGDGIGDLSVWDLQEGRSLRKISAFKSKEVVWNTINSTAFSPDGKRIATANFNGGGSLWDVNGSGSEMTFDHEKIVHDEPGKCWRAAFSPDGTQVAFAAAGGLAAVYDVKSDRLTHRFVAQKDDVNGVAFVDNDTLLSTGDDTLTPDRSSLVSALRMWNLRDPGVMLLAAAASRARTVSVEDNGHVKIELQSGQAIDQYIGVDGRLHDQPADPDEILKQMPRTYADALRSATWANGGRRTSGAAGGKPSGGAAGNAQSIDSSTAASPRLFEAGNDLELRGPAEDDAVESKVADFRTLHGHRAPIVAAKPSPNGRFVVSVDEEGRAIAWDLLRPAFCRDLERQLNTSSAEQEVANLKKWFNFMGRTDLAQSAEVGNRVADRN